MDKTYTEDKYVICHCGHDVVHYFPVTAGSTLSTGQPEYEEFDSQEEWLSRLAELGVDISTPDPEPEPLSVEERKAQRRAAILEERPLRLSNGHLQQIPRLRRGSRREGP